MKGFLILAVLLVSGFLAIYGSNNSWNDLIVGFLFIIFILVIAKVIWELAGL